MTAVTSNKTNWHFF